MTDTQHTPGPWWFAQMDHEGNCVAGAGDRQLSVAISRPNARLIAAAPELLEACQTLATLLDTDDWIATGRLAVKQARDAIAKATGAQ